MAQVGEILKQEIDGLCQGGGALTDGPSTRKMLSEFSLFMLSDQFSKPSPHLGIMSTLSCPGEDSAQTRPRENLPPNDADEQLFRKYAHHAVMKVLTTDFNCFHHLQSFVPDKRTNYQTQKSEIQPTGSCGHT